MQQYQDLKFVTALHISAYSAIIRRVEIRGNCCAYQVCSVDVIIHDSVQNRQYILVCHRRRNYINFI
jgi:hypothetical protein